MKAEKILSIISKLELSRDEQKKADFLKKQPDDELKYFFDPLVALELIRREAEKEIRTEAAKASGDGEYLKAANRTFKLLKKSRRNTDLEHIYRDEDGRTVIPCSFYAVRLNCDISGLDVAEHREPMAFNFDNFLNETEQNYRAGFLDLPTLGDVRAFVKVRKFSDKGQDKYTFDFGDGLPAVNAEYMLDVLTLLTDEKRGIFPVAYYRDETSIIYLESERGDAILCPIIKKESRTE